MELAEKFPIGSVAYYVRANNLSGCSGHCYVNYGIVTDVFRGQVYLDLYGLCNCRIINGVREQDLRTPTRWQKLPEGWSYETQLIEIDHEKKMMETALNTHINKPEEVLSAIEAGILVKNQDRDDCKFRDEIDKNRGWRIVREYNNVRPWWSITLNENQVYSTYEEAQKEIDDYHNELKRQSELSEHDWAIEQIDNTLNHWASLYRIPSYVVEKHREWILALEKVEDVELRLSGCCLQWRYYDRKKWNNFIVTDMPNGFCKVEG